MKGVRSLLNMRGRLLGYSFEPRPDSSRLSYDHRFINKQMLANEKTSLTRENKIDELQTFGLR